MTITEPYTAVAAQARQATEKSVEAWRQRRKDVHRPARPFHDSDH